MTTAFLAVIIPTESILVTSSYVRVPAIETLPVNVPSTALTLPLNVPVVPVNPFGKSAAPPEAPLKSVAVRIPVTMEPELVV